MKHRYAIKKWLFQGHSSFGRERSFTLLKLTEEKFSLTIIWWGEKREEYNIVILKRDIIRMLWFRFGNLIANSQTIIELLSSPGKKGRQHSDNYIYKIQLFLALKRRPENEDIQQLEEFLRGYFLKEK